MIENLTKVGTDPPMWRDEDDCCWSSRASYLQVMVMGFCTFGNPDEVMQYVKEMLEKIDSQGWGKYEDKPYMFFVYWADDKGFIEHGLTMRHLWLTEKGKKLLHNINLCLQEEKLKNEAS